MKKRIGILVLSSILLIGGKTTDANASLSKYATLSYKDRFQTATAETYYSSATAMDYCTVTGCTVYFNGKNWFRSKQRNGKQLVAVDATSGYGFSLEEATSTHTVRYRADIIYNKSLYKKGVK